jgi:hypothetical protein
MALRRFRPRVFLSRLHFLLRFLGLSGALVAVVGLLLAYLQYLLVSWEAARHTAEEALHGVFPENPTSRLAVLLTLGGAAAVALALVVEILLVLRFAAGRRSLSGLNATIQVALAAALFLALNLWAFDHPARQDWTRDAKFTLPAEGRAALAKLDGETTIVVYQRHKTFGRLSDRPDPYDYAAEAKVVEKVRDLVDQMRALGPKFKVVVLNVEDIDFNDKLTALTKDEPELRKALDAAPENSIVFYARDNEGQANVQRLSFNDFYLLDKTASQEAGGGRGNLVLLNQGVKPFLGKVLNLEEKRPRVGVLVIHEWLATAGGGPDELTMAGLRKSLTSYGFDVKDVILKKWDEFGPPKPDAFTYEESKLNRLEAELKDAKQEAQTFREERQELTRMLRDWETMSLEELTKKYAAQFRVKEVTASVRRQVMPVLRFNLQLREEGLKEKEDDIQAIEKEMRGLDREKAAEANRMTDLRAKLARQLADCDLLIVPRMTLRNVAIGDYIPSRLYRLDQAQADAVRDFLKTGKPVFACFGPVNEPRERLQPPDPSEAGPDPLERTLERLGLRFGRQTVLFNVESKAFAERRTGLPTSGAVRVPPVLFDWPAAALSRSSLEQISGERRPNRIRESMRILARGVGKENDHKPETAREESESSGEPAASAEGKLDLRLRHPRPVYYEPGPGETLTDEPVFMTTDPASWNDDQPFPTRERTPRFEPAKDDPNRGTLEEKRRGPFPIGVAVEAPMPPDWRASEGGPATVRVAAIGHGGLFVGPELSPAREKLLINTCNWLLGRDDVLPTDQEKWSYPRVSLDERENTLWQWGTRLGLPVLFLYLGLVVLLVRRVR